MAAHVLEHFVDFSVLVSRHHLQARHILACCSHNLSLGICDTISNICLVFMLIHLLVTPKELICYLLLLIG